MSILYRLDFTSGKIYIGVTRGKLPRRIAQHRRDARDGSACVIHVAWRKYGEPRVTTLAIVETAILYDMEMAAIAAFNTMTPNGYNMTPGGEVALGSIAELAKKSGMTRRGMKFSDEHRQRISKALIGKQKHWIGRRHSSETKEKIRAANKGRAPLRAIEVAAELRRGAHLSPEHIAKISSALIGNTYASALRGRKRPPRSEEWSARIAAANRLRSNERDISTGRFARGK